MTQENKNELPVLEEKCDVCDGAGGEHYGRHRWANCQECHGSGLMPIKKPSQKSMTPGRVAEPFETTARRRRVE